MDAAAQARSDKEVIESFLKICAEIITADGDNPEDTLNSADDLDVDEQRQMATALRKFAARYMDRPLQAEVEVGLADLEPVIEGRALNCSIADFVRACHLLVAIEQGKPQPDRDIVDALSNGVRLAREHTDRVNTFLLREGK